MAYASGDHSSSPLGHSDKHYQSDGCLGIETEGTCNTEKGQTSTEELIASTGGKRTTSSNKIPLSLYHAQSTSPDMVRKTKRSKSVEESVNSDAPHSPEFNQDLGDDMPPYQLTSTPVQSADGRRTRAKCDYDVSKEQVRFSASCKGDDDSLEDSAARLHENISTIHGDGGRDMLQVLDPSEITVPIKGYEIMEQRARFTVFKIQVCRSSIDSWYVFRRYTDFVQLNDKLGGLFPGFRLALPPKKWFGDNFDPDFLEDRTLGLQAFINNITGHKDVCNSEPVRDFFCFDDPPGPHDSLEESRSLCEALEEKLYNTRKSLQERDAQISLLSEERDMYRAQVEALRRSLRLECSELSDHLVEHGKVEVEHLINNVLLEIVERTLNSKTRQIAQSPQSDTSLAECDQPTADNESETQELEQNKEGKLSEKIYEDGDPVRATSPESGIGEGTVTTPSQESPIEGAALLLPVSLEQNGAKATAVPEMS